MQSIQASGRSFASNVLLLGGASAAGPLIALLAYPGLARIHTAADLGALGIFEAVLSMLLAISTLRYHLAVPLPHDDVEAASLLFVSLGVMTLLSLALTVLVLALREATLAYLELRVIADMAWLLPATFFCGGLTLSLNAWLIRERKLEVVAVSRIAQGAAQAGGQLSLGLLGMQAQGLIIGLAFGRLTCALVLCWRSKLRDAFRLMSVGSVRSSLGMAWKYRQLPLLSSWSAVIGIMGQQASVLMLASSLGAAVAGWYSLAFLVVAGPGHIFGQAIDQAFQTRMRKAIQAEALPELSFLVFRVVARMIIVPAMIFVTIAPALFGLALGSDWMRAGEFCAALTPSVVAALIGAHLPTVVVWRHWQRAELLFNIALAASRWAVIWWLGRSGDALLTVQGYALVGTIFILVYSASLLVMQGIAARRVAWTILRELLAGACFVAPLLLLQSHGGDQHPILLVALGLAAAAAYLYQANRSQRGRAERL